MSCTRSSESKDIPALVISNKQIDILEDVRDYTIIFCSESWQHLQHYLQS